MKKLITVFLLSLISVFGFAQTVTVPFTSSGTWICPAGVTSITVECWGAGGAGGAGGTSNKNGGGGGGGGAYSINSTVAVTPTTVYNIVVGTGGLGTAGNGGNGAASIATFGATIVTANGGSGGKSYNNGFAGGNGGVAGTYAGGNGGSGSATYSGGGGGGAGSTGVGNAATGSTAGAAKLNNGGAGGAGIISNSNIGNIGGNYGGGGSGGTKSSVGGSGAAGYVVISYMTPGPCTSIVPPVNDEPCNATLLTVGTACTFAQSNNGCATASEILQPTIPAPGCASYSGGDIWFKVTVPASGRLIVDMDDVAVTDCGMAWYTSTTSNCNNLNTLVECDDDNSQNGMMPMICRTGTVCTVPGDCEQNATLIPGSTVWIRVWEYGNDDFGNLEICAYDPGDGGATSTCATATTISALPYFNSATTCCKGNEYDITDGCLSSYQDGEDYLYKYTPSSNVIVDISLSGTASYTGIFVTDKCPDNASANCVGSATSSTGNPSLCGVSLTAGTTYYIMIDTDPTPNCTPFSINIRESLSPSCGLDYTISDITYSWTNMTSSTDITLPIDDRYSEYIPIGFTFCYDGIGYTRLLVSSNAYVIFDAVSCAYNQATSNATPGGSSDWSIAATVPNSADGPRNCIMFPWMDTDPNDGGTISYKVIGTAPNRILVIAYADVAYFDETDCPTQILSSQVKLYETSNNIEILIKNRDLCTNWNSGSGIVGLHNYNGTIAKVPTGYNYGTNWTASNKAWRFTCNCVGCTNPLPVELINFTGNRVNDIEVELKWSTASETNNDYFEVQRLIDEEFQTIGIIDGNGNSNEEICYEYVDYNTNSNVQYYRLKQVDYDGVFEYSNVIRVNEVLNTKENITIYPNPVKDELNITLDFKGVILKLMLIDIGGKESLVGFDLLCDGDTKIKIPIYKIENGIYMLKFMTTDGDFYYKDKIIIKK